MNAQKHKPMKTLLHMRNNFSGYIRHEGVFLWPGTPSGLMCGILNSKKQAQMMNVSTIDGQIIPKKRIKFN